MQRLEVSRAIRRIYTSLGTKGLIHFTYILITNTCQSVDPIQRQVNPFHILTSISIFFHCWASQVVLTANMLHEFLIYPVPAAYSA